MATIPQTIPFTIGEGEEGGGGEPLAVTGSVAQGQTVDVSIRLQALNGTWETCGSDRAIGVPPETLSYSHDAWGPKTASFDLKRPVFLLWPDLGAFTPVEIEVGGVVVWEGRTGETPIKDGAEQQINVQCEGWQAHLDDDVYQRIYVHSRLTDWKDTRSSLATPLTVYTAVGQVQVGSSGIVLTFPNGAVIPAGQFCGATLDLGPAGEASAVAFSWESSDNASVLELYCDGHDANDGAQSGSVDTGIHFALNAGPSGTTGLLTFSKPHRYITFLLSSGTGSTQAADSWIRIKAVSVFRIGAYASGAESVLTAGVIGKDALERATLLLSTDYSQIAATSFHIPDFVLSKASTPRETIEAANAYHNYITKLLTSRRFSFQPRPTAPLLEIGAWSQSDTEDASANSGADIYSRAIVEAQGPDSSPLIVERTAAQQPTAVPLTLSSPALPNPSFDTDTAGWEVGDEMPTFVRDTSTFDSAPASGKLIKPAISSGLPLKSNFTGTFIKGVPYRLTFAYKATNTVEVSMLSIPDGGQGVRVKLAAEATWVTTTVTFTPKKNTSTVSVSFGVGSTTAGGELWIDSFVLQTVQPTIVDRRDFRRTKVIQMSSAITTAEGNQLADIFLQSHMTTPFKGTASLSPGSIRRVLGGQQVHPSQLGNYTQQLMRFGNLTDPDTGGIGRDGTIHEVAYTHRDQKAQVTLDDARANFDALLARLAVVQTPGS